MKKSVSELSPQIAQKLLWGRETATSRTLLLLSNVDLYATWLWLLDFIEALPDDILDSLIDIFSSFGTGLHVLNVESFGELIGVFFGDGPFLFEVGFVSDQDGGAVFIRFLLHLMDPVLLYSCIFYFRYVRNCSCQSDRIWLGLRPPSWNSFLLGKRISTGPLCPKCKAWSHYCPRWLFSFINWAPMWECRNGWMNLC